MSNSDIIKVIKLASIFKKFPDIPKEVRYQLHGCTVQELDDYELKITQQLEALSLSVYNNLMVRLRQKKL